MKGYLIAIVFFAVFCLAIVTVRQQTEALRAGYRISELLDRLEKLRDANDRLRLSVERLRSPASVMENAERLNLKRPRTESRSGRPDDPDALRGDLAFDRRTGYPIRGEDARR